MELLQTSYKIKAFTEEERLQLQEEQKEAIYKEKKRHISSNLALKTNAYHSTENLKLEALTRKYVETVAVYKKKIERESEAEQEILKKLKQQNDPTYTDRFLNYMKINKKRSEELNRVTEKLSNIKARSKTKLRSEFAVIENEIKNAEIITDLTLNKTNSAKYTCQECGAVNKIKCEELIALNFGLVVNNITTSLTDMSKRLVVPTYKCKKCKKMHIYSHHVIVEAINFGQERLNGYKQSLKNSKRPADKEGWSYIVHPPVYSSCLAIEIDNSLNEENTSTGLRLDSSKLDLARELSKQGNKMDTTDVFNALEGLLEVPKQDEYALPHKAEGAKAKLEDARLQEVERLEQEEKNLEARVEEFLNIIVNPEMIEHMNLKLVEVKNNVAYEKYTTTDLDSLSFEELTAPNKLYSKEVQTYLNGLDKNLFINKDIVDLIALVHTEGDDTKYPKALIKELNDRYTEFKTVDVMELFSF